MMPTYICLLRGINVSGHKIIKMFDLKASFESLDFTDVTTYIQSGNIVFKSEENNVETLQNTIHQMLLNDYGFEVTVIIIKPSQIQSAVSNNPFEKDATKDQKKFYVVFLQSKPLRKNIDLLATYDYSPEEYVLDGKLIYFYAANGAAKAKMNNNFFESKLKVKATTRNWHTVQKLVELSQ